MDAKQIENTQVGVFATTLATVCTTLTGFSLLQAISIQNLISSAGGFFIAPYFLNIAFFAHVIITGILVQITVNIYRLAFYSFKAAYDGTSPQPIVDRYWNRVLI